MTACPHHPGEMGNTLGRCRSCDREAAAAARANTQPEEDQ